MLNKQEYLISDLMFTPLPFDTVDAPSQGWLVEKTADSKRHHTAV